MIMDNWACFSLLFPFSPNMLLLITVNIRCDQTPAELNRQNPDVFHLRVNSATR